MKIDDLLKVAVKEGASDVHVVAGRPPILRIDGKLFKVGNFPTLTEKEAETAILQTLNAEQKSKLEKTLELDISYEIAGGSRFRVNFYYEKGSICLAARVVSKHIPTMEELNMPDVVKKLLDYKKGLILVTGPTGCGKSTSLAAMMDYINENYSLHITTIEDPIEFIIPSKKSFVTQRQLGEDTKTFTAALKHVFRQDPDVIMVGEMRDLETIATAITLAETGHLVLSTLHTNSAPQTIDRIIDVFPPHQQQQIRLQVALTLRGVVSQRLIEKESGGRIANWEILINNVAVANSIRENKVAQINNIIHTSQNEGMLTADKHLEQLFDQGLITEEVFQENFIQQKNLKTMMIKGK